MSKLADWALHESTLNVTEYPPGSNKNKYAGIADLKNGVPWCAVFVSAGVKVTKTAGVMITAGTGTMKAAAVIARRWSRDLGDIKPGDVIYRPRIGGGHVEIAVTASKKGPHGWEWTAVGGNTASGAGVAWNGGAVVKQVRYQTQGWTGRIRPK